MLLAKDINTDIRAHGRTNAATGALVVCVYWFRRVKTTAIQFLAHGNALLWTKFDTKGAGFTAFSVNSDIWHYCSSISQLLYHEVAGE